MNSPNREQLRAVLWDLDGTLADTEKYHWLSWQEVMEKEGVPVTYDQFLETFGQRNHTILTKWLGEKADESRIERIGDAKEEAFRELIRTRGCHALPGGVEWVRHLDEQDWRQAIASSAPKPNIDVMLEALGISQCFNAVVSSEDVTAGKPDPQVFLQAASKLDITPSRCIVVEDAAAGIEGAKRAGMKTIGVRSNGEALPAMIFTRSLAELPPDTFDRLIGESSH